MKKITVYFIFFFLFSGVKAQELPVYKDSSKPVEESIDDLLKKMTTDEKVEMIAGVSDNSTPDTYAKDDDPNTILQALASFWSDKSTWIADKGTYEVRMGASSRDIRLETGFKVPKENIVEKVHDVMSSNL